jgi:farnesyl-diphosphate farnesyltransferase
MEFPGWRLLKDVSRSFYLTLRTLPRGIRPQIGLAYLLARSTDTIADTHLISVERRRSALRDMRIAIAAAAEGKRAEAVDFGELAEARQAPAGRGSAAERELLERTPEIIDALEALSPSDRTRILDLLGVIVRGQEADLIRFGSAGRERIVALESENDLEEYTYCVAGCVGEFWTRMCRAHLFPAADLDDTFLLACSIRFGKGLQMVNILRDLAGDLRQGRCYIPGVRLAEYDLRPQDLLRAEAMDRFRPLYEGYLNQAEELLSAGWSYVNMLPQRQMRVRLACAWPILIGLRTLARLRSANVLEDRKPVKIRRSEVHRLVFRSLLCYPNTRAWNRMFAETLSSQKIRDDDAGDTDRSR